MVSILAIVGGLLAAVLLTVLAGLTLFMRAMNKAFYNIQVGPPSPALLQKFDQSKSQLFRYLPELRGKIAWVDLGASFPTPVHQVTLEVDTPAGKTQMSFALKREDMSSRVYGGACALVHNAFRQAYLDKSPVMSITGLSCPPQATRSELSSTCSAVPPHSTAVARPTLRSVGRCMLLAVRARTSASLWPRTAV